MLFRLMVPILCQVSFTKIFENILFDGFFYIFSGVNHIVRSRVNSHGNVEDVQVEVGPDVRSLNRAFAGKILREYEFFVKIIIFFPIFQVLLLIKILTEVDGDGLYQLSMLVMGATFRVETLAFTIPAAP